MAKLLLEGSKADPSPSLSLGSGSSSGLNDGDGDGDGKRLGGQIEGDKDAKQQDIVKAEESEKTKGLSTLLLSGIRTKDSSLNGIFAASPNGLPPFPTGMNSRSAKGEKRYVMDTDRAEGYPEE